MHDAKIDLINRLQKENKESAKENKRLTQENEKLKNTLEVTRKELLSAKHYCNDLLAINERLSKKVITLQNAKRNARENKYV